MPLDAGVGRALAQDFTDRAVGELCRLGMASAGDLPERGAGRDLRPFEPGAQRRDRASRRTFAGRNLDLGAFAAAVGLRARDQQGETGLGPRQVFQVDGGELGAAQCAGEANEDQGAVAQASETVVAGVDQPADLRRSDGGGMAAAAAMPPADPAQRLADRWMLGVERMAGDAAGPGDRRYPSTQSRKRVAFAGGRQVGADDFRPRRDGREPVPLAPGGDVGQVRRIGQN
ncbi:hypothetical protein LJR225_004852 [Phenylobacterium sp. LjRoot225]|uniref:hypothetical protein n=1 Tax=Phenylobacterium sp. LjRoot225 TaxID=3342285 RepID=UPI003ED116A7